MRSALAMAGAVLFVSGPVLADDPGVQLHGDVGVAHAIANPQQREYGFGGRVGATGELTFRNIVGVQAELSFLALSDGSPPSNPALANHGAGYDLDAMGGLRVHPFGRRRVAGLWVDGNFGLALTTPP